MNIECKSAFNKAKELIKRNKLNYGHIEPNVQEFDDGNIFVQYFDKWSNFIGNTKIKETNLIGEENTYISDVKLIFSESGYFESIKRYDYDQTYIIINGSIGLKFEDDSIVEIKSNDVFHVTKDKPHSILCLRDTYILVILH